MSQDRSVSQSFFNYFNVLCIYEYYLVCIYIYIYSVLINTVIKYECAFMHPYFQRACFLYIFLLFLPPYVLQG